MNISDVVSDVHVYGLEDAIKAAKYPYATSVEELTSDVIPVTPKLFGCKIGEGHDQALTGIVVQFDLTLPVKVWTEAQRYHFMDFVSSMSTMHRITKFDLNSAYNEYVDKRAIGIMKDKVAEYNNLTDAEAKKSKYLEILYTNPCGFKLTAKMTTNYRQLKTIYYQRKNHRLPEWRAFCEWIETLPMFKELVLNEGAKKDA